MARLRRGPPEKGGGKGAHVRRFPSLQGEKFLQTRSRAHALLILVRLATEALLEACLGECLQ